MQGPAGVRARIRDTNQQIPEPELCLGFAVPYPGMDLGSSPGISWVLKDAAGSHRAQTVLIASYVRHPVQAPTLRTFSLVGPQWVPSTLPPWSPGAGFCFVQQVKDRLKDLFHNIAKAPNINAGGIAVTSVGPGSRVPSLGRKGPREAGREESREQEARTCRAV